MTQQEKRTEPQLRFPEFSGDWQEKRLGDVLKIGSGKDYKHLSKGNIPVFGTGGFMTHVDQYLYDGETVCIGRKGTIDKPMFYCGKIWTVDTLFYTHSFSKVLPKYIFNKFQLINWKKYNEASGVPSLSKSTLEHIKINFPTLSEQKKIADFLSCVDRKIDLLNKKHDALKAYKKGIIQKIFNQEIRFKDDNGQDYPDWQEKKLGEVSNFFSGGTPLTTNQSYYTGTIPFIKSGEMSKVVTEQFISDEALKSSSAKIVDIGDILYALYGATSGEVAISKISGAINQAVLCIKFKYDNIFMYNYLLLRKQKIISKYLQGGQGNLSADIIKNLKVPLPSLDEQKKIADFLSSLDNKIAGLEDKIKQAKLFKKALLQKMFV